MLHQFAIGNMKEHQLWVKIIWLATMLAHIHK